MTRKYNLHDGKVGSALAVRLTSKASRNAIAGIMENGTVKVHVTADSAKGDGNEALIKLLADVLSVSKSKVEIAAGDKGPDKLVSVLGMDAITMTRLIRENLG